MIGGRRDGEYPTMRRSPVIVLLASSVLLAGCGTEAPQAKMESRGDSAPVSVASVDSVPRRASARIEDFEFTPRRITVPRGGTVRWRNTDAANHTVTFRGGRDLGNLDQGESATARFRSTGRLRYVCAYHPGMRGVVVVR